MVSGVIKAGLQITKTVLTAGMGGISNVNSENAGLLDEVVNAVDSFVYPICKHGDPKAELAAAAEAAKNPKTDDKTGDKTDLKRSNSI